MFGGELDVTEYSGVEKSQARQYRDYLCEMPAKVGKMIQRITQIFEGMEDLCRSKKNMFHPICEGITEVKGELCRRSCSNSTKKASSYRRSTSLACRSSRTREWRRRWRGWRGRRTSWGSDDFGLAEASEGDDREFAGEAALIMSAEGVSYASILKDLKKRVRPEELVLIREIYSKDLALELKCSAQNRGWLNSAFSEVVVASGSVCHLIPRIYYYNYSQLKVTGLNPSIQTEDVKGDSY